MNRYKVVKGFDCVALQRQIRDELSEEINADREKFLKSLKDEFGHLAKGKEGSEPTVLSLQQ